LPDNNGATVARTCGRCDKETVTGDFLTIASRGGMGKLRLGANVTVFLIFFGISLLDAIWSHHWSGAFLWIAFGALFLRADSRKAETEKRARTARM